MRINTICPINISSLGGPGYACNQLLEAMAASGAEVNLFGASCDIGARKSFHCLSIPLWAKPLGYRAFSEDAWGKYTEWRYRRSFKKQDIAYIWNFTSIETYRAIKSAGHIILAENVNTHQATSKAILEKEYHRLGLRPTHGIDEESIALESAKLDLADYVFSPSGEVSQSLTVAGVPTEKILQSSYGIEPNKILLPEEIASRSQRTELTAVFCGRIGIRKGVHLLLEYWVKADVKGKLKLVGNIEPSAKHLVEPYLGKHNIEHVPFTNNLKSVYLDADVLLLPSLEEGSPLVTYLALGAGLPSIVSPMGGGGVIGDGQEGLIAEPHDADKWVSAIRKLFSDAELRSRLANNAYRKAEVYLWSNVGRRRVELLQASLANRPD
ncbi:MAG: glycosyl transferase group 1 [Gallionellaceae bacterium]|nr:MAG: glycosyl transferase group 1 [Gallionellaceae bacterium]